MFKSVLPLTACAIFTCGLIMIFSTTSAEVLDHALNKNTHSAFFRQIAYAFAGLICALGIKKIGYQKILRFSPMLLFFFTILLALTLVPGIGKSVNGSRRWIQVAGFSFQPSEFVKLLIPITFIYFALKWEGKPLVFKQFFFTILPLGIPLLLILIEPNNGTVGVIIVTLVILFFLTRVPLKFWALPLLVVALAGVAFASQLPYVQGRLRVYLNPELDIQGKGHQPYQAKIASGSGKMFGKGPGKSWQKLSYLPEAQNDYIGAIFAEEFGFAGMFTLITLYAVLCTSGFYAASLSPSLAGFYLGASITFLIGFQVFLNLGVVSGLLPSTGLNLPLFSQGGSSLMANIMGIGLLSSVQCKHSSRNFH